MLLNTNHFLKDFVYRNSQTNKIGMPFKNRMYSIFAIPRFDHGKEQVENLNFIEKWNFIYFTAFHSGGDTIIADRVPPMHATPMAVSLF